MSPGSWGWSRRAHLVSPCHRPPTPAPNQAPGTCPGTPAPALMIPNALCDAQQTPKLGCPNPRRSPMAVVLPEPPHRHGTAAPVCRRHSACSETPDGRTHTKTQRHSDKGTPHPPRPTPTQPPNAATATRCRHPQRCPVWGSPNAPLRQRTPSSSKAPAQPTPNTLRGLTARTTGTPVLGTPRGPSGTHRVQLRQRRGALRTHRHG